MDSLFFADNTDFEGLSPYDMADMLKQYFRELPEPILTSKLAETFISIFSSEYGLSITPLPAVNKQIFYTHSHTILH